MKNILIITVLVFFSSLNVQCSTNDQNQVATAMQINHTDCKSKIFDELGVIVWIQDDATKEILQSTTASLVTNVIENKITTSSELTVILEKKTAYYWKVDALDIDNNQGTESEIFAFYTKGEGVLNYAPFTSELVFPENNAQVNATSVSLTWEAADTNAGDTLTYELYFGEDSSLTLNKKRLKKEISLKSQSQVSLL